MSLDNYGISRNESTIDESVEAIARAKQLVQQAIDTAEARRVLGPARQAADDALSLARTIYRRRTVRPDDLIAAEAARDAGQARDAGKAFDEARDSFARTGAGRSGPQGEPRRLPGIRKVEL